MPYLPTIPPEDINDFRRWLDDELNKINDAVIEGQDFNSFRQLHAEPTKYDIGEIVFADGTDWDLGSGQGMYEYTILGWAKLGGGNGNIIPTSHSALQNLSADDHPQYHDDNRGDIRYPTRPEFNAHLGDTTNPHQVSLDILIDTLLTAPIDGDVLAFDGLTSTWINTVSVGGGGDSNPDGGRADSIYTPPQLIDGGGA